MKYVYEYIACDIKEFYGLFVYSKMEIEQKNSQGRQKQRLINEIENNLLEIGLKDRKIAMQDRDRWKQLCVVVMGLNGL